MRHSARKRIGAESLVAILFHHNTAHTHGQGFRFGRNLGPRGRRGPPDGGDSLRRRAACLLITTLSPPCPTNRSNPAHRLDAACRRRRLVPGPRGRQPHCHHRWLWRSRAPPPTPKCARGHQRDGGVQLAAVSWSSKQTYVVKITSRSDRRCQNHGKASEPLRSQMARSRCHKIPRHEGMSYHRVAGWEPTGGDSGVLMRVPDCEDHESRGVPLVGTVESQRPADVVEARTTWLPRSCRSLGRPLPEGGWSEQLRPGFSRPRPPHYRGVSATSWSLYSSSENRLLELRVRDAGSLLDAVVPTIQTPLVSAVEIASGTNGNSNKFRSFITPDVIHGSPFASVTLWNLNGVAADASRCRGKGPEPSREPRIRGQALRVGKT